ncbi:putative rho GTPase-activating protein 7-like 2, partial [Homarus americanus]
MFPAEESDDEEQQCALSGNWMFVRHSRRWSRIVHERSPNTVYGDVEAVLWRWWVEGVWERIKMIPWNRDGYDVAHPGYRDSYCHYEPLLQHLYIIAPFRSEGKVSGESRGLELPEDVLLGQFKRSGSERLRDGAKALLKRMESIKNKKKKRQNRDGVVISGPKLVDEARMEARVEELACVDISPEASPELSSRGTTTTQPRGIPHSTHAEVTLCAVTLL